MVQYYWLDSSHTPFWLTGYIYDDRSGAGNTGAVFYIPYMVLISIDIFTSNGLEYRHEDSTWRNHVREKHISAPVVNYDRNIKIDNQQYCE